MISAQRLQTTFFEATAAGRTEPEQRERTDPVRYNLMRNTCLKFDSGQSGTAITAMDSARYD